MTLRSHDPAPDDFAAWLGHQLDADQQDAERRSGIFPSPAVNDDGSVCLHVRPGGNMAITWYRNPTEGYDDMAKLRNWADTEHGWTQDRVLRETEAKRELLAEHSDVNDGSCGTCVKGQWGYPTHGGSTPQRYPCRTLRLLALPYADRSGYQESWRP